jgi:hypothetical protein
MLSALVVFIAYLLNFSEAAYCNGSPDEGLVNIYSIDLLVKYLFTFGLFFFLFFLIIGERTSPYPIFDEPPTFIRQVKNAMLFEAGPANARFPIVHLWGNPYEIGVAQGTLMKEAVRQFVYKTNAYLLEEIVSDMGDSFPDAAKALVVEVGMEKALKKTADWTAPFTSQRYFDEVRGLADATGIDYQYLYNLQMFPELTKAQCSFFGAWGSAVKNEGYSYQLRSLDFETSGPFVEFNQVTVYHPLMGAIPTSKLDGLAM